MCNIDSEHKLKNAAEQSDKLKVSLLSFTEYYWSSIVPQNRLEVLEDERDRLQVSPVYYTCAPQYYSLNIYMLYAVWVLVNCVILQTDNEQYELDKQSTAATIEGLNEQLESVKGQLSESTGKQQQCQSEFNNNNNSSYHLQPSLNQWIFYLFFELWCYAPNPQNGLPWIIIAFAPVRII